MIDFDRNSLLRQALSFLLGVIVTAGGLALSNRARPAPIVITPAALPAPEPTATPGPVRVYVSGQVVETAVYELPPGSIVADAIQLAGGFTAEAAADLVNLAQPLIDGLQVYVPAQAEIDRLPPLFNLPALSLGGSGGNTANPAGGGGVTATGLININRATKAELETLPRIGPATAQKILDYREDHGPFGAIEELMDVSGIGRATFDGLKDRITVDD